MDRIGHILLIHHSEAERMRRVADWFEAGLRNGAKVLYADVAGWGVDWLVTDLNRRGMRADRALDDKRLKFIGLDDVLDINAENGVVRRALEDDRFTGVRLSVRCDVVARSVGVERYLLFEREAQVLCRQRGLSVLCQNDGRTSTDAELGSALELHPEWVWVGDISVHRRGDHLIQIGGQLDSLDANLVTGSLLKMTADLPTDAELALDLRDVEALTAGACHAMIDGTVPFRGRGGHIECRVREGQAARLLGTVISGEVPGMRLVSVNGVEV